MNVNVGFIGCGTLGRSIATGLAKAPEFKGKIILSDPFNRANVVDFTLCTPKKLSLLNLMKSYSSRQRSFFRLFFPRCCRISCQI
ncbi:MAG: hypothetical protein VB076_01400 [Synergistaceae bacterium]|nr:hypothetical protein [Synergistaceae bacterium]